MSSRHAVLPIFTALMIFFGSAAPVVQAQNDPVPSDQAQDEPAPDQQAPEQRGQDQHGKGAADSAVATPEPSKSPAASPAAKSGSRKSAPAKAKKIAAKSHAVKTAAPAHSQHTAAQTKPVHRAAPAHRAKPANRGANMQPLDAFTLGKYQYCGGDADCVLAQNGCCDCANGGQDVAINKERVSAFQARFNCLNVNCGDKEGDPQCGTGVISCVNHKCKYFAEAPSQPKKTPTPVKKKKKDEDEDEDDDE